MSDVHFGFIEKKQCLENQKEKKNQFSHHLVINFRIPKEWTLVECTGPFAYLFTFPRISITLKLPFDRDKVKWPFTSVQKLRACDHSNPMRRQWKWWAGQQSSRMSVRSTRKFLSMVLGLWRLLPTGVSVIHLTIAQYCEWKEEPTYTSCSKGNSWSLFLRVWLSHYKRKCD